MKSFGCLLVLALIVLVALELALPPLVSEIVAARAPEITRAAIGFPLTPVTSVRVKALPALKLLVGMADSVTIEAGPVTALGYPLDKVTVEMAEVRYSLDALRSSGPTRVESRRPAHVTMLMSEESLNRALQRANLPVAQPRVTLGEGIARVGGTAQVASVNYSVAFIGRVSIIPSEPRRVYFFPDDLEVNGQKAPPVISSALRRLVGDRVAVVDFQQQNILLVLKRVDVSKKQVVLTAEALPR